MLFIMIREQPLNKQGGRNISLGRNIFFCNTLEPRNLFSGVYGAFFFFFFYKFYNCNFQTIESDFFL